jgi:hypothetical protein
MNLLKEVYEKSRKKMAVQPEAPKGKLPPFMKGATKSNDVDPKKSARRNAIQARLASMSKKGK